MKLLATCGRRILAALCLAGSPSVAQQGAGGGLDCETRAISPELGLFDLTVRAAPEEPAGIELAFDREGRPSATGHIRLRRLAAGKSDQWRARVMPPERPREGDSVAFWVRRVSERAWAGPFRVSEDESTPAPPAWAVGAVWYQVFPERFAIGNPKNDPGGADVFPRAWTSAWEQVTPAEIEAARARSDAEPRRLPPSPDQAGGALYSVATARRYGGDLEGLLARLDALGDLGVTALYLNPIFDAPSMHKYDAADYRHVDPTLAGDSPSQRPGGETVDPATWVWTGADRFLIDTLLPAARRRGIRVVLDGVWNHTSTKFWAFRDVARNGRASPFAGWYQARFDGDRLAGWTGWPNRPDGSLPQFARGPDGNIVAPVRAHIADITRRWMDPDGDGDASDGIDGWRLDVAPDIPTAFWREWCPLARSINPRAALFGETWFADRERVGGGLFDAQMNYPFAMAAVKWLDGRDGFGSDELGAALAAAAAPSAVTDLAQMNLLGSHDTARIATMLNNPGRGYGGKEKVAEGAEGYRTGRPGREVYELVVLGVALQSMWPGSPMVYAGDEWGVFGADDPDDRKPVPWPDLGPYDNADEGPDAGLRDAFRAWLRLRSDPEVGPTLRYGSVEWLPSGSPEVAAFVRRLNDKGVIAVLNRSENAVETKAVSGGLVSEGSVGPRSARWWPVE
jgi:glycosidase